METIYIEAAQSCSPSARIGTVYGQVGNCAELQNTNRHVDQIHHMSRHAEFNKSQKTKKEVKERAAKKCPDEADITPHVYM